MIGDFYEIMVLNNGCYKIDNKSTLFGKHLRNYFTFNLRCEFNYSLTLTFNF